MNRGIHNAFLLTLSDVLQTTLLEGRDPVSVPSGTDLYLPGDEINWIYFPTSGLISLISVMDNGDEGETGVVGREGALGVLESLGSGCVLYRAVVQIDLVAWRIPASRFTAVFGESPALRTVVAAHTELNLAELRQSLACRSHHSVTARLAWWLLECQDRTGLKVLALTQEFLGAMLGSQRSAVSQASSDLKQAGLIQYSRGVIEVLDRPGLERRACECYARVAGYRRTIEGEPEWAQGPDHQARRRLFRAS